LSSGRWRSAARDLSTLEEDLQTAFTSVAESVAASATELDVAEETLWTVGDAAGTLDLLRDAAVDEVDEDSRAARVLQGEVLYGASFLEDPDLPDRGTTLLFGWPEPLAPATWPWQANWVVSDGQDADDDELDLYESGEMGGEESLVAELADELSCSRSDAKAALRAAALALTRASLLSSIVNEDDEEEEEEEE
jgi:hypothetical protein